ncbi:DUF6163 family protein [Mangrovibrevibacter kandeliae]|uniref:DUF6163 family protein n=1 Tax=Mangrovibrevibacter kandeliae TaxID=2968473 RepID=UPI0021175913|nr:MULTISPECIES: DUF6163 family protein [unclassified Aurantimonas]MCQ8781421.1 DUF6163 family protein [Aurantimonas sp. CSK15Z-1]MCW4114201.1 DUF6163 family protein [Aurantimonas sp. MSK8Z-1]
MADVPATVGRAARVEPRSGAAGVPQAAGAAERAGPRPMLPQRLVAGFCRLAGLALFAAGIGFWIRIVGFYDGPLWRFDLMPPWWKAAAATLAVLYPVAGVGLWMAVSWGVVLWVLVAGVEAVMHLGFPTLFGGGRLAVALNAAGLLGLVVLRLAMHRRRSTSLNG